MQPWQPLLDFWFGDDADDAPRAARQAPLWWGKSSETDALLASRFGELAARAAAGELARWEDDPAGRLALILLLDQLPRNLHRHTPAAELFDTVAEFRRIPNLFEILSYDYWHANYGYTLPTHVAARRQAYLESPAGRAHVLSVVDMKLKASGKTDAEIAALGEKFDFLIGACDSRQWLDQCNFLPLGVYRHCVAVPREHPLARKTKLTIQDLYGQTLMMVKRGDSPTVDRVRDYVEKHPAIAIEDTPQQAASMRAKSELMEALEQTIRQRGMTQQDAAALFGVTQPRISDLMRGKISLFSLDALMDMAATAGLHPHIVIEREPLAA